jgi:hypothetical protein
MVENRAAVPILMDVYTSSILTTQYVAYFSLSDRAEPNHSETEGELRRYGKAAAATKGTKHEMEMSFFNCWLA